MPRCLPAASPRSPLKLPLTSPRGCRSGYWRHTAVPRTSPHLLHHRAQVQVLPPEVVQALVEHCSALGRPDRVERCVLHLDVTSLDLDQVGGGSLVRRGVVLHLDAQGRPEGST